MGGSNSVQPQVRTAKKTYGEDTSSTSTYKMDIGYSVKTAKKTFRANTSSSSMYKTVQPQFRTTKTTPEEKRLFGFFFCKSCKKSWQSGNSWPNTGQKCKKCYTMVLPFKQQPLEQSESGSDNKVQHPRELCGKCIQLGRPCNERYFR